MFETSVIYNIYRTFKKEHINRDQFLIRNTEEEYNETARYDIEKILKRLREFTDCDLNYVIDFGCGDGRIARFMSKHCKDILLVDISPHVLDAAQDKMKEYNVENASFVLADDFDQENVADFIYCLQVMQHNTFDEQIQILNKIKKALKPTGVACIHLAKLENKPPEYKDSETCMCFTKEMVEELATCFSECTVDNATLTTHYEDYYLWAKK